MSIRTVVLSVFFSFIQCKLIDLSCDDIRNFVDGHNLRRLSIARGEIKKQPAGVNLSYLVWDKELAAKAANWASTNKMEHNPNREVETRFRHVGENLYSYTTTDRHYKFSPTDAIQAWFNEHKLYKFGDLKWDTHVQHIGHYTQLVWAETTHIGCAVSKFLEGSFYKYVVVCNYGPSGNFIGMKPYQNGTKLDYRELKCTHDGCDEPYGKHCPC